MSKGIFHDLIVEEYERSSRKDVDVVEEKRTTYIQLFTKAKEYLNHWEYESARYYYEQVVTLIENDPYPDEYNLEDNSLFCLKCCLCYSMIQICTQQKKVKKAEINATEKLVESLIELYPSLIMPYYLKLLLESRKPNNISTMLLCITLQAKHSKLQNITETFEDELFKELLPNIEEIMTFQRTVFMKSLTTFSCSDIQDLSKCFRKNNSRNMAVQTSKTKSANKYLQTNTSASRNMEVQVNIEVQEYKKKLYDAETKLRDNINTNNKRLRDMQIKVDAAVKENQQMKEAQLKECEHHHNELITLRRELEVCQEEKAAEVRKNERLQKFILDLIDERYNMRKNLHESLRDKGSFMITYLGDLMYFCGSSSVDLTSLQTEVDYWHLQLMANIRNMEVLMVAYKSDKTKLIQSSCSDTCLMTVLKNWPEIAQCQRDCDSVVFKTLPMALRKKSEMEAQLLEMRNNLKGFLNYAQTQCEPHQPWMTVRGPIEAHIIRPQYTTVIPVATALTSFSVLRPTQASQRFPGPGPILGASNVTTAHPEPLTAAQAGPYKMTSQQGDGKRKKRKEVVSPPAELTAGPSKIPSPQTTNSNGNVMEISSTTEPAPKNAASVKYELVSDDEASTSECFKKGTDEKVLFHYVSENCPGYTEENITLAMLKVLENFGGSFDNIPRQQILNNTKSLLRSPMLFDDISEQCCTICFEEHSKGPLHTLPCAHIYHRKCIRMWLKKSGCCPVCRTPSKFNSSLK